MGALTAALKLKAKAPALNAVAREIALDAADNKYQITLLHRHIPGVSNISTEARARQVDPKPKEFPRKLLELQRFEAPRRDAKFWRTWAPAPPGGLSRKRKR